MDKDAIRAAVRAASGPAPVARHIKGLGDVFISVQTAYTADLTRARLQKAGADDDGLSSGRAIASILCDASGAPAFDIDSADDLRLLSNLPMSVISDIFRATNEVNAPQLEPEGDAAGNG